jgi:hypothetical protein
MVKNLALQLGKIFTVEANQENKFLVDFRLIKDRDSLLVPTQETNMTHFT